MGNIKRISRYFREISLLQAVIVCALTAIAEELIVIALTKAILPPSMSIPVIIAIFVIGIIIALISAMRKTSKFRRAVHREGDTDNFDQDVLSVLGDSFTIYTGRDWLLYRSGYKFIPFRKAHISEAKSYGTYEEGRKKSMFQLLLTDRQEPVMLTVHCPSETASEAVNAWLGRGKEDTLVILRCPFCHEEVSSADEFCGNCGMKLIREQPVDPFPTQSLNTAPLRANPEPYRDHSRKTAVIAVALFVLAAAVMYLLTAGA